jgi:hypothetical protein
MTFFLTKDLQYIDCSNLLYYLSNLASNAVLYDRLLDWENK